MYMNLGEAVPVPRHPVAQLTPSPQAKVLLVTALALCVRAAETLNARDAQAFITASRPLRLALFGA